jgi:hypothetical protein
VLAELSRGVETPDFSASILSSVERERAFVPRTARRKAAWWRSTPAIVAVAVLGAAAALQRTAPDRLPSDGTPRVVSAVVEAGRDEASHGAAEFVAAVDDAAKGLLRELTPAAAVVRGPADPSALRWDVSTAGLAMSGSGGLGGLPAALAAAPAPGQTFVFSPGRPAPDSEAVSALAARGVWCWCGVGEHLGGCAARGAGPAPWR